MITQFGRILGIASAGEAFAQFAPHAAAQHLVGEYKLRFAFAAEAFLPGFHGTVTGSDGHWANLDAVATVLAKIRPDTQWVVHVAVLAPPDKADSPGLPDLGANPHTASAQNTVLIPKRIPDLLDPTAQGNILNSAGIGSLGHQQLREVAAQFPDLVRISHDHHALLHVQGAGSGDIGTAVDHVFYNAQPASACIGQIGDMTQMGDADAVFDRGVEHAAPLGRANYSPVYVNVDILQHLDSSLSQAT